MSKFPPVKKKWIRAAGAEKAFTDIKVWVSVATYNIMVERAKELECAVSRLGAIAIDNELDTTDPFNYECNYPDEPYVEYMYAKEAKKLIDFLTMFPDGTSMDTLLLCRRDMGMPDRKVVMAALRELIKQKQVELIEPTVRMRNRTFPRVKLLAHVVDPSLPTKHDEEI